MIYRQSSFKTSRNYFSNFLKRQVSFIDVFSFMAVLGLHCCARLSLVSESRGCSLLWCMVFSLQWLLMLWGTGSRCAGSVISVHRLSCPVASRIFPDQGPSLCLFHWQVDSYPLYLQGSPPQTFLKKSFGHAMAACEILAP